MSCTEATRLPASERVASLTAAEGLPMPDVMEDIITALDQARFVMADDFDRMRSSNMKAYRTHGQVWVDGIYQEYEDDGWGMFITYGAALLATTGEVLLDFVQGVGASAFIDPLRFGAGVSRRGRRAATSRIPCASWVWSGGHSSF